MHEPSNRNNYIHHAKLTASHSHLLHTPQKKVALSLIHSPRTAQHALRDQRANGDVQAALQPPAVHARQRHIHARTEAAEDVFGGGVDSRVCVWGGSIGLLSRVSNLRIASTPSPCPRAPPPPQHHPTHPYIHPHNDLSPGSAAPYFLSLPHASGPSGLKHASSCTRVAPSAVPVRGGALRRWVGGRESSVKRQRTCVCGSFHSA